VSWARIRSWHLTKLPAGTHEVSGWQVRTLCDRLAKAGSLTVEHPPEDERTCERCFQIREGQG
jgi:hypothetical protein